jgi:DNA-binding LacI/PurR family transcriptional regulator
VPFSLRRPFEVELVEDMFPVAQQLGYDLLLGPFTPGREQDVVIDELLRYRCAGINDDASGTRQAVDHLVGLGHRDIAYIDGGATLVPTTVVTATAPP